MHRYKDILWSSLKLAEELSSRGNTSFSSRSIESKIVEELDPNEATMPSKILNHDLGKHRNSPRFLPMASKHSAVALTVEPSVEFCCANIATWMSGKISVPLAMKYSNEELAYIIEDSGISSIISTAEHASRLENLAPRGTSLHILEPVDPSSTNQCEAELVEYRLKYFLNSLVSEKNEGHIPAIMLYTSGTTGKPKGVVHTHASLASQIATLLKSWDWSSEDLILHSLPLNHVHGFVNALCCPLAAGATVKFLPKFSPQRVWSEFVGQDSPSIFMGVPTMYHMLLDHLDTIDSEYQKSYIRALQGLRVAICGSSACPIPTQTRWARIAGAPLLERYGMTETGMILGNPLHGIRVPGTVGIPFPGVKVRINSESSELEVLTEQLFSGYWKKDEETRNAFTHDGFFRTGDTVEIDPESKYFKILGRTSIDIIKKGGFKISALELESKMLEDDRIKECAVIGLPDSLWGEKIGLIVALKKSPYTSYFHKEDMIEFLSKHVAKYKLPDEIKIASSIPRNAMGKINKKTLRKTIWPDLF